MRIRTLDDIFTPISFSTTAEADAAREKMVDDIRLSSSVELLKNDAPLNPVVFDAVEYDGFTVEKVIFQSLPGYYVTGNLYRPNDTSKKYPGVLNPHGHWEHGRLETIDLARIPQRCANQALRGMVAFAYDMVGYNDATQVAHRYYCDEYDKWNFGRFSLQLNNSLRAVDFLMSLPYVDAERIGCTGCSGGGTQTYFLTALDQRVKVAAPINMASTRMQGGCNCENAPFLRVRFNNIDYMNAIAPRPLFMSGSDGDWTVTSETVEFPAVEKLYALYGAKDRYEHFYRKAPHCYELCTREKVYSFLCRSFGLDDSMKDEVDMEFDTDALRIGNIEEHVSKEGFIHNEEELFEMVKKLMNKNLAALSAEERMALRRRIFLLDEAFDLDIPYVIENEDGEKPAFVFGAAPEKADVCGVHFATTYNYADDAKRVSALTKLMRENPTAEFRAAGKTAALCTIAGELSGHENMTLTDVDWKNISIPGIMLTQLKSGENL